MIIGRFQAGILAAVFYGLLWSAAPHAFVRAAEKDSAAGTKAVVADAGAAAAAAATEARVRQAIDTLSADAMEGRGPGTKGLDKAAEYVAAEFQKIGLKTDVSAGAPFQKFTMVVGAELGKKNEMTIVGPPGPDGKPQLRVRASSAPSREYANGHNGAR